MSQVAALNSSPQSVASGVMQTAGSVPERVTQPVRSDAEVVAKAASTEIKPSAVNEVTQPTREVVAKAAEQIQSFVQSMGRNLSFSVDSTTGYHIVRVTNPETGDVVRQLPTEELIRIAQSFAQLNAALVHQKA
jgi:flagellar protein FlaG